MVSRKKFITRKQTVHDRGRYQIYSNLLTYDLDSQSLAKYGNDPYTAKEPRPNVTSFKRWSGNGRTDGPTNATNRNIFPANAVDKT